MELVAEKREVFGRAVRQLRIQGLIPAELYGHGLPNLHLSIPAKEFLKVLKEAGENTVVTVVVGSEKLPALIYDVARHPVSDEIVSVDLYQVRMDEKIKAAVPLEFTGEAPVVKEAVGLLVKSMHEVEVEALPADLPREITVDLGGLTELGQSIYAKDLSVPAGVKIVVDLETVVVAETEEKKAERDAQKEASSSAEGSSAKEVKK